MSTDPFVILGIARGATQSEILEAYKTKRSYYSAHVFDEGEAGAEAARMLELLDTAYQEAMEATHEAAEVSDDLEFSSSAFDQVKEALRAKDYVKAQSLLDNMTTRGGEWHYYQAIIFYDKSWLNESKKQLELALQIDPDNAKYQKALDNLKKKIDGSRPFEGKETSSNNYSSNNAYTQRTYQQQSSAEDGCCAACQALWCADCCCECMGGDLIRCC